MTRLTLHYNQVPSFVQSANVLILSSRPLPLHGAHTSTNSEITKVNLITLFLFYPKLSLDLFCLGRRFLPKRLHTLPQHLNPLVLLLQLRTDFLGLYSQAV